jgi:hypothetical protein
MKPTINKSVQDDPSEFKVFETDLDALFDDDDDNDDGGNEADNVKQVQNDPEIIDDTYNEDQDEVITKQIEPKK